MYANHRLSKLQLSLEQQHEDLQKRIHQYEEMSRRFGHVEDDLRDLQRRKRKLSEIERALRRLMCGNYGICERCGVPIDPARLEAIPETTLCYKCSARYG
nr:TraR/DksA C4-type zinc finger protein [Chloroflexota bacterium]